MTRDFQVQIDRSAAANLPFPAWEKLDKVTGVSTNIGRDYEDDDMQAGLATVNFEYNAEDTIYATDDTVPLVDDSYGNAFSYMASDYITIEDSKVVMTFGIAETPNAKGKLFTYVVPASGSDAYEFRMPFDPMYAAIVKPGETYCVGFLGQETAYTSPDPQLTEHAKVYWWTDAGVLISVQEFFTGLLATSGTTQIKGKVTAPSIASYATIGSNPRSLGTTSANGFRRFQYSNFQWHKYDAAYEAAHGGNYLKPFTIDSLQVTPPQAGTKVRIVSPGNQFDRTKWFPMNTLGAHLARRDGNTYNVLPGAYDIDQITTISDFFTSTNTTLSLNTTTPITGTKSLNIVTTATSPATINIGALSTTYCCPVVPGQTYQFSFAVKNNIATTTSLSMAANYFGGSTNMGTQSLPASSGVIALPWTFTAPANVYAVQFVLSVTGGVRNFTIDNIQVVANYTEPDTSINELSYLDFERLTTSDLAAYTSTSLSSVYSILFDSAQAHSGNRCLKLTKANAVTTANVRFGATVNTFPVYTEARWQNNGVTYQYTFWARASAANANTKIQAMFKSNMTQSVVSNSAQQALTTSWQKYTFNINAPSGATGLHLGILVTADASPAIDVFIDEVSVVRFKSQYRSDLSSLTANSRISVYDVDAANSGVMIVHYGNDVVDDANYAYKWYGSGRTRTRYKCTIKSLGTTYDAPGGSTAVVAFNVIPRNLKGAVGTIVDGFLKGCYPSEINVPVTLPTNGGSVVVNVLGPDIPWAAVQPTFSITMPQGAYTIGYEFIDEYIGPDGYEAAPDTKEATIFRGTVETRDDTVSSMSVDGINRSITEVELQCADNVGQLSNVKLNTAYKQTVLNDDPLIYLPLDDDLDSLSNLSNRLDVDFSVKTVGTPASWGVTSDSMSLADTGGSLTFVNPPLAGLGYTQGQVIYGRYNGSLINKYEGSYEIWFSRQVGAPDMIGNGLFNHNSTTETTGKIYIWMTAGELWYKWGQTPGNKFVYNIGSAKADGLVHYAAMTMSNGIATAYFDGVAVGTFAATERTMDQIIIGGNVPETYQFYAGNLGHFAWYDHALTSNDIRLHWEAGIVNRTTDSETDRIKFVLNSADQAGIPAVLQTRNGSKPVATSELAPANWSAGATPAELIRSAAGSATGVVFAGGDGRMVYENRYSRMSYGISQANTQWHITTGDNSLQPDGDYGASPDFTKVVNEQTMTGKFGGAAKDGSVKVADRISQNRYGKVTDEQRTELYNRDDAQQTAYWNVAKHNKPLTTYKTLRFQNINDTTDDFCRRVQLGDYLYGNLVNANGLGKGVLSHFIERIKHTIEPKADGTNVWYTDVEISLASNQQVWIVEDATYGQLDANNKIAF